MKKQKKLVSRSTIIEAIKTEPLQAGKFFQYLTDTNICGVCVIGAILRKVFGEKFKLRDEDALRVTKNQFSSEDDINRQLKNKNFLGALSIFFEQQYDEYRYEVIPVRRRRRLINFVKKHFPKTITMEIDLCL